jgi:imidazoleglycerol-phosphate dehydratase
MAQVRRATSETEIEVKINLDGRGRADVHTGVGFLDHMLTALARHARFDLDVHATGDLNIDEHHTVEDVAIAVGRAMGEALGSRSGIMRMGDATVPMDEALAMVAVDIGGRGVCIFSAEFDTPSIGTMGTSLVGHFFQSLAAECRLNLHARLLAGADDHHRAEALFKALARALHHATRPDPSLGGDIPSTKQIIEA